MDREKFIQRKHDEEIQEGNLEIVEDENALCKAYANLSTVQTIVKNNELYYFINDEWITEKALWESCLR